MIAIRSLVLTFLLASATVTSMVAVPAAAQFALDIRVDFAPPPLPVYEQPPLPAPNYIWTPGYWAWEPDYGDYYWVPGTWVLPPRLGYLWTPAWWDWDDGIYLFHRGYWGERVGWYGGVNYGFGYTSQGFFGGRWDGGHFAYNRAVNNITNVNITNVYEERVNIDRRVSNVSYSGGPGGIHAQPTPEQRAAARGQRFDATPDQERHAAAAQGNRALFAADNHGVPPIAATPRPAVFRGPDVARGAPPGAPSLPLSRGARAEGAFTPPYARSPNSDPRGNADPYYPDGANTAKHNGGPPRGYGGRPPSAYGGDRPPPGLGARPPAAYGSGSPPPGYGGRLPEKRGVPSAPPLRPQQPPRPPRPPQSRPEVPRQAPHPEPQAREHPESEHR